ncbi:MAG: hypothetical protein KBA33_08440 [Cloacibacterium sp.]|jgi:hypothetical protein|nr:hypothetical protein [Cloacibacterium sp.]
MENEIFDKTPPPAKGFYWALGLLMLFSVMSMSIDVAEFLQHQDIRIPLWYFYIIFLVDIFILLGWVGIYFHRKIGVYLFPMAILTHFTLHNYYLSTFLYNDIFILFLFVGIGLLVIIPRWLFFK